MTAKKIPTPAEDLQAIRAREMDLATAVAEAERKRATEIRREVERNVRGEPVDAEDAVIAELDKSIERDTRTLEFIRETVLPRAERRFELWTTTRAADDADEIVSRLKARTVRLAAIIAELEKEVPEYVREAWQLDAIGRQVGVDFHQGFREGKHLGWALGVTLNTLWPHQFDRLPGKLRTIDPAEYATRVLDSFIGSIRKRIDEAQAELDTPEPVGAGSEAA